MHSTRPRSPTQLSRIDVLLARIGVRPEDKQITLLLFSNMFFSGLAVGMIRVCAYTLFLAQFSAQKLSIIAIALAVVGTLVTLIINRITRNLSIRGYLFTILAFLVTGLLLFRTSLALTNSARLIFVLPLFLEVAYMLFSMQFSSLLSRLLNVRQAKRLAGLTRSGEFLAEIVAGFSIALLLQFISVPDLLLVSLLSVACIIYVVNRITLLYSEKLHLTAADLESEGDTDGHLLSLLKIPFVRLIAICYTLFIFAYFFLDVAFYDLASTKIKDETELAAFLGQFFGITGFLTLISLAFLFAPFLRKFGVLGGIIAFPLVVATGAFIVGMLGLFSAPLSMVFFMMVVTNGLRFVLQSSVWRPSIVILFQVLPDQQRYKSNALIEGIVDPASSGLAGICLLGLTTLWGGSSTTLMVALCILLLGWIVMSFIIRQMYLDNLVITLTKRKLGNFSFSELDNASLSIIESRLGSPHAGEVLYCLDLLEGIDHKELPNLLAGVLDHTSSTVRIDVLQRMERLQLVSDAPRIAELIHAELDVEVLCQAFKTYGALGGEETQKLLRPYLQIATPLLHRGALVGLLRYDHHNIEGLVHLQTLVGSDHSSDRQFAATVLGDLGQQAFSGFLLELLEDTDNEVVASAILAVAQFDDENLIAPVLARMMQIQLQPVACGVLRRKGNQALSGLQHLLSLQNTSPREQLTILGVIRDIGGSAAIDILVNYVNHEKPEVRHGVYLALAQLNFQANNDDKYIYAKRLEEEVETITRLLAAMEDFVRDPAYTELYAALGSELDQHRDNSLLLTSFLYPSAVLLDTRANIDSNVTELRIFAIEVLDNILSPDAKQLLLPIFDDLTVTERLELLGGKFPQLRLTATERFRDLLNQHYNVAYSWTKACIIHHLGKLRMKEDLAFVIEGLRDDEPIVRETALWAQARLVPSSLEKNLDAVLNDTAHNVRKLAERLVENRYQYARDSH